MGCSVDGLQMSISAADLQNLDVPEFQVALRNAGKQDVTLNLGFMLANGKVQLPQNISLNVTDAPGKRASSSFLTGDILRLQVELMITSFRSVLVRAIR